MDLKEIKKQIKELVNLIQDTTLSELEVEQKGVRIKIKRDHLSAEHGHMVPFVQPPVPSQIPVASQPAVPTPEPPETKPEPENGAFVRSPIVGTFYRAPAPDALAYVDVGDVVKKGQVLCIIEAMKLMNEIESDADGRIVEILVENAQPVEYGEPLFRIERRME